MSEQRLRIDREHDGKVAVVTLTRPDKHNALDRAMFDAIDAAALEVRALAEADEIEAVVLQGEGKSFCSAWTSPRCSAAATSLAPWTSS